MSLRILTRPLMTRALSTSNVPLVLSPSELRVLPSSQVTVLDATWFMPGTPRNARDEFISKRIPGSQYLDLDAVASPHELGLKHMMPSAHTFALACRKLGITPSSHVVIYDSHGVFSSPRALFMFKAFGHESCSILNGGLPLWEENQFPVENQSPQDANESDYPMPTLDVEAIASYEQIVYNSHLDVSTDTVATIVLDARTLGRYLGSLPEPRPGLPSGHIPNSLPLPYTHFVESHKTASASYTTLLKPPEIRLALRDLLGAKVADEIIEGKRAVVTTCGSGMTAAILWLGLKLIGAEKVGLYDESWTGYASRESSKIESV